MFHPGRIPKQLNVGDLDQKLIGKHGLRPYRSSLIQTVRETKGGKREGSLLKVVTVKLSLCLTKYYAMRTYPVLS
jgi:hypothetical protein